jgi:C4-dicarboxylate-specific signal transduction histidine kinase
VAIDYFGLAQRVQELQQTAPDGARAVELAWSLRQRDTSRALALAAHAERAALPPWASARVALLRAEAAWLHGDPQRAGALATNAAQCFSGDEVGLGDCALLEAVLANQRGEDTKPALRRAREHFVAGDDTVRLHLVDAWEASGEASTDPSDAVARWRVPLAQALDVGHPGLCLFVHAFHAVAAYQSGDVAAALRSFQFAHEAALACGQRWWAVTLAQNIGLALAGLNDHAGALTWLEDAHEHVRGTGWGYATAWCLCQRATVLAGLGRHVDARGLLVEALAALAPFPQSRNFALASQALGEVLIELGDEAGAMAALDAAEAAARHLATPDLIAGTLRFKALLLSRCGDVAGALAAVSEALALAQRHNDLRRLSTSRHVLARIARENRLAPPQGSTAASGAIHHLELAMADGARMAGFIVPAAWHRELSADYECAGHLPLALQHARLAAQALERAREREAGDLATALRVRHETDRALHEAAHQRDLAAATQQRAAVQQALAEAKARLEAERTQTLLAHSAKLVALGRLAAGVVHEMSHPVGTLLLLAETLQAVPGAGSAAGMAQQMAHEAHRLKRLTQRLRDFARPAPLRVAAVSLADAVADARALYAARLTLEGIAYEEDVPPLQAWADAERLGLVVANLVFNAADALAGRAHAHIRVSAARVAERVRLSVRDSGPGVPPGVREHLFEPFFTTKPHTQGLGLGLALSAESLAAMNGRIECLGDDGRGACFVVELDLA